MGLKKFLDKTVGDTVRFTKKQLDDIADGTVTITKGSAESGKKFAETMKRENPPKKKDEKEDV